MQIDLNEVVDEFAAAHAKHTRAAGLPAVDTAKAKTTLADIIAALRAKGVTLSSILSVVGPILSMIFAGTPAGSIITAVLALLQGTGAAGS